MPKLFARAIAAAALFAALPAAAQDAPPLLNGIFRDQAVLQRDRPIRLWGKAQPGERLTVALAGNRGSARADRQGAWQAELPAMPAGGPHVLTVTAAGGASQAVSDILIGDVWLCSGQSNMEMAVAQALGGAGEVNSASDPETRILTVAHATDASPLGEFTAPVRWQPVSKTSIGDFSAACWFMARELRRSENVPFGLIDASWGGTAINAWRSEASMAGEAGLRDALALLALHRRDAPAAGALWGRKWGEWWSSKAGEAALGQPWQPDAPGEWRTVPALTYWESWGVPELAQYNGLVWYRTEIELTPEQAAKPATITFGVVDDLDMTFVNGIGVGSTSSWDLARSYALAPGTLRAGVNRIVIGAYDSFGPGGFAGTAEQRAIRFDDGSSVPLPEPAKWSYRITPGLGDPPHAPWEAAAGLGTIYNGMIAPLGGYGLRGVAWYQGESDAGTPAGYADRLARLMRDWRGQFGNRDLPFLIVQLPEWGARVTTPVESGFASIRDEQRRAVEGDAHASLAVTMGVGDPLDLHPANKQAVGRRLARAARVRAYGGSGSPSGPRVASLVRGKGEIVIRFTDLEGYLTTWSSAQAIGFEICTTMTGGCSFIPGHLTRNEITLLTGLQPVARVRFCWGDSPLCNLVDGSGLPVGPFELKVD